MIAVDTNILAYLYLAGSETVHAEAILIQDPDWVAPLLWRSEFRNVLSLYMRRNILRMDQVLQTMAAAEQLMRDGEVAVESAQVLALAASSGCSAYDCEFVAVAQQVGVPLVTSDGELLKRFPTIAVTPQAFLSDTRP